MKITLPLPPLLSKCFTNARYGKGRVKTQEYRDWIEKCILQEKSKNWKHTGDCWYEATYTYYFPIYTKAGKKRIVDIDNFHKSTGDILGRIIEGFDDYMIKRIVSEKMDSDRKEVDIILKEIYV